MIVYQEKIKLEDVEVQVLPLFIQVAHAMHIIGSVKSAVTEGDSEENDHWMQAGRDGLIFTRKFWKDK